MENKTCNLVLLSAYADGELSRRALEHADQHLAQCQRCQEALEQYAELSTAFRSTMQHRYPVAAMAALDGKIFEHWQRHHYVGWWDRFRRRLYSKWMLVPVTAAVAAVAIWLPFQTNRPVSPSPSAIVQSVSGDLASVMIMQTPATQQTVIWISETDDDQDNAI